MSIKIDFFLKPANLTRAVEQVFSLSAEKIRLIAKTWKPKNGPPGFTVNGQYTSRRWTEWIQGFQYGSAVLQFDATGDTSFLDAGREPTGARMAPDPSHVGVHDHGFNNISTYGNPRRLMGEGRIAANEWELHFYELALIIYRETRRLPGYKFFITT